MKPVRIFSVVAVLTLLACPTFAQDGGDAPADEPDAQEQVRQERAQRVTERLRRGMRERFLNDQRGPAVDEGERRRPRGEGPGDRWRDGPLREWGRAMQAANNPETVDSALAFFEEHSPFRYGLFTRFAEDASEEQQVAVARLRQRMVMNYARIDLSSERFGARSRELAIERVSAEDRIAELAFAFRSAEGEDAKASARDELKSAVQQLILVGLSEREYRLERLRERLQREMAAVEEEKAALDERSEEQVERLLDGELPPALDFGGRPRLGRGGPGAGPRGPQE
ncbi:MAG: hypothetical protein AAGD32_00050 [Planctomycetota bacterium]